MYAPGSTEPSDAPLPLVLAKVVGEDSAWYTLLLGMGLLGLVASFYGILLAAARATFELGRAGYAPALLGRIHLDATARGGVDPRPWVSRDASRRARE